MLCAPTPQALSEGHTTYYNLILILLSFIFSGDFAQTLQSSRATVTPSCVSVVCSVDHLTPDLFSERVRGGWYFSSYRDKKKRMSDGSVESLNLLGDRKMAQ